jgi:hypothetical protein
VSRVSPLRTLGDRLDSARDAIDENERLAAVLDKQVADLEDRLATLLQTRRRG